MTNLFLGFMLLFQHPDTVTGIAQDDGWTVTSCYDGNIRLFDAAGVLQRIEQKGHPLSCVAMRDGLIATGTDLDYAIGITAQGTILRPEHVTTMATVRGISDDARYAVSDNLMAHRVGQFAWACVPWTEGQFAWPMAVDTLPDGNAVTVGLDGYIRWWTEDGHETRAIKLASSLNCVDVGPDGRLVVGDWDYGITILSPSGEILRRVKELSLVRSIKFRPDGNILYGTHGGRFVLWDGVAEVQPDVVPEATPTGKPKGRSRK